MQKTTTPKKFQPYTSRLKKSDYPTSIFILTMPIFYLVLFAVTYAIPVLYEWWRYEHQTILLRQYSLPNLLYVFIALILAALTTLLYEIAKERLFLGLMALPIIAWGVGAYHFLSFYISVQMFYSVTFPTALALAFCAFGYYIFSYAKK